MGIDGIGKPPAPPAGVGPSGPAGTGPAGDGFRVDPSAGVGSTGAGELERLGRGEISLDEYLEVRVTEATEHLADKLSAEQLDFVKSTLRSQLETDPVLVELVRRATGKTVGA
jgi:hypothetical protein